jgi:hypothetical protein
MTINPGDTVARKTRVLYVDTIDGINYYSLEQEETDFLEPSEDVSYWIPTGEVESIKDFLYLVSQFWGKFLPDSLYGKGRLWEAYLKTESVRKRLGI